MDRLETPTFSLDVGLAETSTAAWLSETTVVIGSSDEEEDLDDEDDNYDDIRNSKRLPPSAYSPDVGARR